MTNCPNCGAPIVSTKCEYCGTVFSGWKPPKDCVPEVDILKEQEAIVRMVQTGLMTANEARLALDQLRLENELMKAKTRALENATTLKNLYADVLNAIMSYGSSF